MAMWGEALCAKPSGAAAPIQQAFRLPLPGRPPPGLTAQGEHFSLFTDLEEACPERERVQSKSKCERHTPAEQYGTVGGIFRMLEGEDPRRIFLVRRVNSLGFKSEEELTSHYSEFGPVKRVLVAHSKKNCDGKAAQPKIRPGSIGVVVMRDARSVARILQVGREHRVCGLRITVEPYEPSSGGSSSPVSRQGSESGSGGGAGKLYACGGFQGYYHAPVDGACPGSNSSTPVPGSGMDFDGSEGAWSGSEGGTEVASRGSMRGGGGLSEVLAVFPLPAGEPRAWPTVAF